MKTVHKYTLNIEDTVELRIPEQSTLLKIDVQRGLPQMWFLVDDALPKQTCRFLVRGTGHRCDGVGKHLGTFMVHGGDFVFHVFEPALE